MFQTDCTLNDGVSFFQRLNERQTIVAKYLDSSYQYSCWELKQVAKMKLQYVRALKL